MSKTWTYHKVFEKKPEKLGKFLFLTFCFFDLKLDHNSAMHAKIREKSLVIESRIEYPNPMLKISGKIIFPPLWFWIQKLDHNSGLHAKIREKSLKLEGFYGL